MTPRIFTTSIISLILLSGIFACSNKSSIKEVNDDGMTIQLRKVKNSPDDAGVLTYATRLIPEKVLLSSSDNKLNTALWYHMDSCFYLQAGERKIYAAIIQPIANGVTGTFEYLLSFDAAGMRNHRWSLVYQDKYLNHKKYTLSLESE